MRTPTTGSLRSRRGCAQSIPVCQITITSTKGVASFRNNLCMALASKRHSHVLNMPSWQQLTAWQEFTTRFQWYLTFWTFFVPKLSPQLWRARSRVIYKISAKICRFEEISGSPKCLPKESRWKNYTSRNVFFETYFFQKYFFRDEKNYIGNP